MGSTRKFIKNEKKLKEYNMKINGGKIVSMATGGSSKEINMQLRGTSLKHVNEFRCLGSTITTDGRKSKESVRLKLLLIKG